MNTDNTESKKDFILKSFKCLNHAQKLPKSQNHIIST
jgi:hypothetical protein